MDKKREKRRDRHKKKIEDSGSDDEVDDGVVGFCFLDGFWGDQDDGFWGDGFWFCEDTNDGIGDVAGGGDDGGFNGGDGGQDCAGGD